MSAATTPPSLTLSRGIQLLEIVAASSTAPSIDELAESLGVHRSVAYRLLRTLEMHSLLRRDEAGRVHTSVGLAALATSVEGNLQSAALPVMSRIADTVKMSCFIAMAQGSDCFTLVTAEPSHSHALTQLPGTQHHLDRGAPGIAVMSGLNQQERDSVGLELSDRAQAAIAQAQADGYAVTTDEVIPGVGSIAVPLIIPGYRPASLAVVYPTSAVDEPYIASLLNAGVEDISAALMG